MTAQDIPLFKHFAIELHSDCNRDCFFCPRHSDTSGKRKDRQGRHVRESLPTEKVLDLLDQVKAMGYRGKINFHHLSEPFLDKRLIPMACEARKRGFACIIHTNGDILRKNYKLSRTAARVFSEITVGLYDYKNSFQENMQKTFWRFFLRGTDIHFSKIDNVYPRHGAPVCLATVSAYREKVDQCVEQPCFMVREQCIVHYDGNVAVCCEDFRDEFDVGNVLRETIADIWWSPRHTDILKTLALPGGRKKYPLCRECPFPAEIVSHTIGKN
jgi:radical SAM protein with 4Fe4S-binding SPASM domain